MDQPELSLGPVTVPAFREDSGVRRKRKQAWDEPAAPFASVELQLSDPLPFDWEQCLDLQTGRMYYLNRKTLKRSWSKPREEKLDLELNISSPTSTEWKANLANSQLSEPQKRHNSSGNMVAIACNHCHLLVMLCKSSPTCPNCKYLNSLSPPPAKPATPQKLEAAKPFETLSLLH